MGLENEVQGKASNEAWAAKQLYSKVQQMNIDVDRVIVTIADADSLLPEKYFACLTYKFCTDPGRLRRFWQVGRTTGFEFFELFFFFCIGTQAHITFLRNIYRIPPLTRIIDMLLATDHLSWVSSTDILIPMSTYSVSLHLLHRSGYWDVDVVRSKKSMLQRCFCFNNVNRRTRTFTCSAKPYSSRSMTTSRPFPSTCPSNSPRVSLPRR